MLYRRWVFCSSLEWVMRQCRPSLAVRTADSSIRWSRAVPEERWNIVVWVYRTDSRLHRTTARLSRDSSLFPLRTLSRRVSWKTVSAGSATWLERSSCRVGWNTVIAALNYWLCNVKCSVRTIPVLGYWVLGNIHRYWVVLLLGDIFCCSDTQYNIDTSV